MEKKRYNSQIDYIKKLANQYEQERNYKDAITMHTTIVKLNGDISSYERRAFLYFKMGDYHKAIEDYTYLLSSDKNNPKYLKNRAALYKKLKDYDRSIKDLESLLSIGKSGLEERNYKLIVKELDTAKNILNPYGSQSKRLHTNKIKGTTNNNTKQANQANKSKVGKYPSKTAKKSIAEGKADNKNITYLELTLKESIKMIKKDWRNIGNIDNPSKDLQRLAVGLNTRAIDYIGNPEGSILSDPYVAEYLNNKNKQTGPSIYDIPELDYSEKRQWW